VIELRLQSGTESYDGRRNNDGNQRHEQAILDRRGTFIASPASANPVTEFHGCISFRGWSRCELNGKTKAARMGVTVPHKEKDYCRMGDT
jgi:hypothetical protein